jgi:hypothetical protein
MWKRACLALVCCVLLATVAFAEKKRIKLKNGQVFVGDVVEKTKDGIKVQGKMGVVSYANDEIASIESVEDPKAEYADKLAKAGADDFAAQLELARWAMDKKLYKEAVERAEAALAIKKDEQAGLLLRQAKGALEKAAATPSTTAPAAGGAGEGDGDKVPLDRKALLKDDDISRIRVAELREDDKAITVEFRNDAIEKFIRKMRGVDDFQKEGFAQEFRRWTKAKQAKYILDKVESGDPIQDDVIVKNDPAFMREFRGPVWRWISGNCAATTCHGAEKGKKGLKLYNYSGSNPNIEYTNFLILDSYRTKGGEQMIRRDDPEASLLLQHSLPVEQAQSRHPKKVKQAFPNRSAAGYKQTLEWIKSLAGPLHPDYRIKDRPPSVMAPPEGLPGLSPRKAPATQPAKKADLPF